MAQIVLFNVSCISFDSYIKPQPPFCRRAISSSCISFDSYIKPQRLVALATQTAVVYLLIPTSNHNLYLKFRYCFFVVYLLIPTSNHNLPSSSSLLLEVVYLLIPTSNHNHSVFNLTEYKLYIF